MNFETAKYVKSAGGPGRTAEPNPYTDVVASIALKKDKDGDPEARTFLLPVGKTPEETKTAVNRVKRQLSDAGAANTPQVTVRVSESVDKVKRGAVSVDDDKNVRITFWTVTRQTRTRKTKPETATA